MLALACAVRAEERPLLHLPTSVGDVDYTPGRGLRVGDTGLWLGGYGAVSLVRNEGDEARLSLEDLSLFVGWQPIERLQLFAELEGEELATIDDGGDGGTVDAEYTTERLHGDYTFSDAFSVRIGKFLTPVGRWNVIHAQPLVWTTSRPVTTVLPFDAHATGGMIYGSFFPDHTTVRYSVYGQPAGSFDEEHPARSARFDHAGGARLEVEPREGPSLGLSYLGYENRGWWHHVTGLDLLWRHGPFELMAELAVRRGVRSRSDVWGLYLQPVWEVHRNVFLVARYEHVSPPGSDHEANLAVGGVTVKPAPWLVLKAEYLATDHRIEEAPPGFACSVAVLF